MSCSKGRDGRLLPTITACRDSLPEKPSGSGTLLAALRDAPEVVVVLQALVALLAIAGYWRVYHVFERDQVLSTRRSSGGVRTPQRGGTGIPGRRKRCDNHAPENNSVREGANAFAPSRTSQGNPALDKTKRIIYIIRNDRKRRPERTPL